MVRNAFLTIYAVASVVLSSCQRLQVARTKSGRVLLASFNQLATLSCTYLAVSDRNRSRRSKPRAGSCFSTSICSHQTPRGRVTSVAKRRTFSSAAPAHGISSSMAWCMPFAILGRTLNHATSRTPKCLSAANCCTATRDSCKLRRESWPIPYAAQHRTRSDACPARNGSISGSSCSCESSRKPAPIALFIVLALFLFRASILVSIGMKYLSL